MHSLALLFAIRLASPIAGVEYHQPQIAVSREMVAVTFGAGRAVYFTASRDDPESADAARALFSISPDATMKEIKIFDAAGHGTTIFEREPSFMNDIAAWLEGIIPRHG